MPLDNVGAVAGLRRCLALMLMKYKAVGNRRVSQNVLSPRFQCFAFGFLFRCLVLLGLLVRIAKSCGCFNGVGILAPVFGPVRSFLGGVRQEPSVVPTYPAPSAQTTGQAAPDHVLFDVLTFEKQRHDRFVSNRMVEGDSERRPRYAAKAAAPE
jgi:hypothetical protein